MNLLTSVSKTRFASALEDVIAHPSVKSHILLGAGLVLGEHKFTIYPVAPVTADQLTFTELSVAVAAILTGLASVKEIFPDESEASPADCVVEIL